MATKFSAIARFDRYDNKSAYCLTESIEAEETGHIYEFVDML